MHNSIDQDDGQMILGHSDRGRDRLSAGHGDSTWVRQSMAWYESFPEHLSETAWPPHAVNTFECITGGILPAASA